MMRHISFILILMLCIPTIFADFSINEIMFNPLDNNEWVEFFTGNSTYNISDLTLTDNYNTDEIMCCAFDVNCSLIIPKNNYVMIFDQDTTLNITNLNFFYCVDDKSIGNGLGNSNDKIIITSNESVLVNFSYSTSVEKGKSLSLINGTWTEASPTPGIENMIVLQNITEIINSTDLAIEELLPKNIITNNKYSLFKIKNLDYPNVNEKINVTFYYNISKLKNNFFQKISEGITFPALNFYTTKNTGEHLFNETGTYNLCGKILNASLFDQDTSNNILCISYNVSSWEKVNCNVSLSIDLEKQIYESEEKISFYNEISNDTFPFTIEYWVEDLFGVIVRNKIDTSNDNKKTYTPKSQGKAFIIRNNLTWIGCNNTNNKTKSDKLFVVKGNLDKNSKIEVEKIYLASSNKVSFGDTVRVKLNIYKGDTTKNSLKAYIEKSGKRISYTTYFNVYDKFQNYDLTIPIQLKSNCNNNYKDSHYYVYVEGLDKKIKEKIIVNGRKDGLCFFLPTKIDIPTNQTSNKLYELVNHTFDKTKEELIVNVVINNPTEETHNYSIWSYVYKGPVSYSGDRENNKININLNKTTSKKLILENTLSNISIGKYKLKVKILRDDKKTPYEIIEDIAIYGIGSYDVDEIVKKEFDILNQTQKNSTLNLSNKITSNVVYTSSSEKIKNYALFLVIFMVALVGFAWFKTR